MTVPAFDPKELAVAGITPASPYAPEINIYSYPVSEREGYRALMEKKPLWQIIGTENRAFTPRIIPDNIARALVLEAQPFDADTEGGGKDMFGLDWEYVPLVGGSMIRPGKPFMEDANEWREKVVWPDIETWDWKGSAEKNNGVYLNEDKYNVCWFQTGWYERLISFMDFEGAIMAMVDEDQKDAVKELFGKLTDLYIRIFGKYIEHFPLIDMFYIHDDWGSQKETFFSPAVAAEMIVPYMRRVTDYLHSKGKFCEFHSCGQLFKQVPNMIDAGWDAWGGQSMNDMQKIYELYGDKIIVGIFPDAFDPETATEEEQRQAARAYAEKFCNPDKPSFFNRYGKRLLTPAFREELYIQSRLKYSGQG